MPPDTDRLRATVEHLASFDRPSASPGEHQAAQWIAERLRDEGLDARVETERAHGTYWVPMGLLSLAGGLAGFAAKRGGRRVGRAAAALGLAAAAGIADEVSAGPHVLRRALPSRDTFNVVAEAGDPAGEQTLVFVSHHDAAHGGFIFNERFIHLLADTWPEWWDAKETSPQIMQLVASGPALAGLGALTQIRPLRAAGTAISFGSMLAFLDIGGREVVPGANDNLSAVAVIVELARLLREEPVPGVRVLLVSTGSEESFMEGMRGFVARHAHSLDPATTRFVCVESVGSPELIVIEGEGMLKMDDYSPEACDLVAAGARRAGLPLRRGLKLGLATDGLIAHRAGYRTATLASITRYKTPANYHSQRDKPSNVDYETVRRATAVCRAVVEEVAAGA
ncbi:MAG: Cosmid L247 [uncultured Solirubrobacteraceae bacterium]|uniref:Cosmid L247 n=1 Tax=uncultured Solirubrobacteraceae bacterium TaxID=1162706 RepID=A0A6J4S1U2_9ACTN|nr:MAG: Cosmid L247 [uncultured Solirubrobacteraceae bacterium]